MLEVEFMVAWDNHTWTTMFISVPADDTTDVESPEFREKAISIAQGHLNQNFDAIVAYIGIYHCNIDELQEKEDEDEDEDDSSGEYISVEECQDGGKHLESCDDDGYCNLCGEIC